MVIVTNNGRLQTLSHADRTDGRDVNVLLTPGIGYHAMNGDTSGHHSTLTVPHDMVSSTNLVCLGSSVLCSQAEH